jgi:hypothetical protein
MNTLRSWLFDNLGLKLVALLMAVLVYLNVYTDRPNVMLVSFPLRLTGLADTLAVAGTVPSTVQAEVRGTGKQLLKLRLTEPELRVPLEGVSSGRFQRSLGPEDLPLGDDGLVVERMAGPVLLDLSLEPRERRTVPVAVPVEGVAAEGAAWTGHTLLEPARVLVTGPRSAVLALDTVRLVAVRIEGRRDTVRVQVAPDTLPPGCVIEPSLVQVTLPVVRTPR